jgi:hypothetical protein
MYEQPYVDRTVRLFRRAAAETTGCRVWFVTTVRESAGRGPTTHDLIAEALRGSEDADLGLLHCTEPAGNKATQLNWAVAELTARGALAPDDYVAVFDFDAQPGPALLAAVLDRLHPTGPDILQVLPLNLGTLAGPPSSSWQRALVGVEALHHAVRSLGVERVRLTRSRPGAPRAQYAMGAGLVIRHKVLAELGGFPFVDDIPLGYAASLRPLTVTTVDEPVIVDLPGRLQAQLRSLKLITTGVNGWVRVLADSAGDPTVRPGARTRLALLGLAETWELSGYPWLGLLLTPGVRRRGWAARGVVAAFWILPLVQTTVMRRRLAPWLDPDAWAAPATQVAAASLTRRFWRTAGTGQLLWDAVGARLSGRERQFQRGDRAAR